MNRIEVGKSYVAARARSGETSVGKWELLVTQDERGNSPIAVFVENMPSGVSDGEKFRITSISNVAAKNRQCNNGMWVTDVSVTATVEKIGKSKEPAEEKAE